MRVVLYVCTRTCVIPKQKRAEKQCAHTHMEKSGISGATITMCDPSRVWTRKVVSVRPVEKKMRCVVLVVLLHLCTGELTVLVRGECGRCSVHYVHTKLWKIAWHNLDLT